MINYASIIGKNIKKFRKQMEFTQGDLAAFLHIDDGTVSSYETGRALIPADSLRRLQFLLEVRYLDEFYEEDND